MGVYVDLTIMPEKINADEWQSVYEESLALLKGCPMELMGRRREYVHSAERVVHTRQLEHYTDTPGKRHWHVVGDFESKTTGESFCFYYDITHYYPFRKSDCETDDIILNIVADRDNTGQVFRDKTQGHPYHIPMLAVAMLVEDRFPKYAVAGGNIDIHQAKDAQSLVNRVLEKEIALPVRSDTQKLFERLSEHYHGKEVLNHFDYVFRGDRDDQFKALFAMSDRNTFVRWFSDQLGIYDSPHKFGAIDLYILWLNVTKDLKRLCELACKDKDGPGFDTEAFASALASTWLTIPESERDFMDVFLKPEGKTDTVASQFGMVILDMNGLKGRNMRHYIAQEEALKIMDEIFPSHSEQIRKIFKDSTEEIKEGLSISREGLRNLTERDREPGAGDGSSFMFLESIGEASEIQTLMLQSVAFGLNRFRSSAVEEIPQIFEGSPEEMKYRIIKLCGEQGPVLTEDAWEWIDREDDPELLDFIMTLMLVRNYEQKFWNIRKGLLENRELCKNVSDMTRDKELLANIAEKIGDVQDISDKKTDA